MRCLTNNWYDPSREAPKPFDNGAGYKRMVDTIMATIDAMPAAYRTLANDVGYVEAYWAWRRGQSVETVRARHR